MREFNNVYDIGKIMSIDTISITDRRSYEKVGRIYTEVTKHSYDDDTVVLKNLLQTEGDINYRISEGSRRVPNLLHAASHDPRLINLLVDDGADFTCKDDDNRTVVHKIIQEAVDRHRLLLHIKFRDDTIDTILAAHVKFNNPSNPCDDNGMSHFHAACITNNATAVEFFLNNGVYVNQAVDADSPHFPWDTPLHLAVKYTCPEVVDILLKYGANVYLKNNSGLNPLHLILRRKLGKYEVSNKSSFVKILNTLIKFVIDNGVDSVKDTDDFGFCKFHVACLLQDESLAETVLAQITYINQAVNLDSPVCPGYTPLHFAAFANVHIFKLLLEKGANVEVKNADDQTAFDLCLRNYTANDIYSILLSKGEWQNIVLSDNKTKLIDVLFAMDSVNEFVQFLDQTKLASTVRVPWDSPMWPGYTLLHLAVVFAKKIPNDETDFSGLLKDATEIIGECLKRGADVTAADAKGSTALHLAFYMQKRQIVEYLLNHHEKAINPVDKDNLSHFHIACATQHQKAAKHFLSNGVDINSQVHSTFSWQVFQYFEGSPYRQYFICPGSTALHISIVSSSDKITKKLLKHGADVHAHDVNGFTPIHRLCDGTFTPTEEIVDLLLSVKNLKNSQTHCGFSHLHVACHFRHCEAIKNLLKRGANINAPMTYTSEMRIKDYDEIFFFGYGNPQKPMSFLANYAGYTPLHFSCSKDGHKAMKLLIEKNADLLIKNEKGDSPLRHLLLNVDLCEEYCTMFMKTSVAQTRLEEEFGITKLHLACHLADDKLVKNLINHGASVNAKVRSDSPIWQGRTALHLTVRRAFEKWQDKNTINGLKKIVGSLLKHGADPLLVDDNNDTPFHLIKPFFHRRSRLLQVASLISILFEHLYNFNVNSMNYQGLSLFHIACITENVAAIEKFLKQGVEINEAISYFSRDCPGSTPLHLVMEFSEILSHQSSKNNYATDTLSKIIDLLLENGANINAIDAHGDTPLHIISKLKIPRGFFIEKFISNGADKNASNVKGDNPLATYLNADTSEYWEDIETFLKHGCDINMYNSVRQHGYIGMWNIEKIIQSQRLLDVNSMGRTVFHNIVCQKPQGHFDYNVSIELITNHGCDIDHQDNEGKTALHLAVSFNNTGAVMELLKNGADINTTDNQGKSALAYCNKATLPGDRLLYESRPSITVENSTSNGIIKLFALHVYKLEFGRQWVNEQNKQLLAEQPKDDTFDKIKLHRFHGEMEKAKTIEIGNTSFSLYEFLMNTDMDVVYMNMTKEERREMDQFFENIVQHEFRAINCLIKLKHRQTIKKAILTEPALTSLNSLVRGQLPQLCCRNILKFLRNQDLKHLIDSVN